MVTDTVSMLNSICRDFIIKCAASIGLIGINFAFGGIEYKIMFAILTLVIFDFITAIKRAYDKKEEIQSAKIFRTAWKIFLYFMMISAGVLAETVIGFNFMIEETILGFLALTELISILENISHLGFGVPESLLNRLKDIRKEK